MRWKGTPVCPHCASERVYYLNPTNGRSRKTRTGSDSARRVWKCGGCRKQFSVLTGTIFHGTKVPVRKWVLVVFEMASSKNGISAREIERKYDVTPKTAWFMLHRLREAMRRDPLVGMLRGEVEVDETYFGPKVKGGKRGRGAPNKTPIVTLIDRSTGEARSVAVPRVDGANLGKVIREHMAPEAVLMTDGLLAYRPIGPEFAEHHHVKHEIDEWAKTTHNGRRAHINHAEGYFGQLKRSIDGTHQVTTYLPHQSEAGRADPGWVLQKSRKVPTRTR
jgi:transposase-like protein